MFLGKYIRTFENFSASEVEELMESLNILEDRLLTSIGAKLESFENVFKIKSSINDLNTLSKNPDFLKALSSLGMKMSDIENLNDYETFLTNPFRYILIRNVEDTNLVDPQFIIIQNWNETTDKWNPIKVYSIEGKFSNFYNKLSSKTVKIEYDGETYLYKTTNKNEWVLQNKNKANKIFKPYFRKEEFLEIIKLYAEKIDIS